MFSQNRIGGRLVIGLLSGIVLSFLAASLSVGTQSTNQTDARTNLSTHHIVSASQTSAGPAGTASIGDFTNCRYGAAYLPSEPDSGNWLPSLNSGWYVTFSMWDPTTAPSSEFVSVVRLRQDFDDSGRAPTYTFSPSLDYVAAYAKTIPGSLWLIGNEIEIDNTAQDNIMPDVYARAYHEAYHMIKSVDPTASVGIGSVTMVTPGRQQYLEIILDTYRKLYGESIPVDVWNIHLYILPERNYSGNGYGNGKVALGTDPEIAIRSSANNPDFCPLPTAPDLAENDPRSDIYCRAEHDSARIFRDQLLAMRQWMKEKGQQNKPLIISEYGSLFNYKNPLPNGSCEAVQDEFGRCMYPERVTDYMQNTIDFMENATDTSIGYPQDGYRLVQRWLWYSLITTHAVGMSSNLLVDNYSDFAAGSVDALTLMGETYKQLASDPNKQPNLVADGARSSDVFLESPGDTGTAMLAATFRNNSELNINTPFAVSFYSDKYLTQYIGTVLVDPAEEGLIRGCSWTLPERVAEFEWSGLTVGVHSYWAKVDSSLSIAETREIDNVTSMGTVTVYPSDLFNYNHFVPVIRR